MPSQKTFKRTLRARMRKKGEAYTTAPVSILAKVVLPAAQQPSPTIRALARGHPPARRVPVQAVVVVGPNGDGWPRTHARTARKRTTECRWNIDGRVVLLHVAGQAGGDSGAHQTGLQRRCCTPSKVLGGAPRRTPSAARAGVTPLGAPYCHRCESYAARRARQRTPRPPRLASHAAPTAAAAA